MKKIAFILCMTCLSVSAQEFKLNNPVTESWIVSHLRKDSPRAILTPELLRSIIIAVDTDPVAGAYYQYLYKNAVAIIDLPVLERVMTGRRLLTVSREAVKRIGTLSIVYSIVSTRPNTSLH